MLLFLLGVFTLAQVRQGLLTPGSSFSSMGASIGGLSGFNGVGSSLPALALEEEPEVEEVFEGGDTPANVVIERVVSYPETGATDLVTLRNTGGQIADLTGWTMTDSKPEPFYTFGQSGCEGNATIYPQEFLELTPLTDDNPCGFPFGISFRDSILLYNARGTLVANATWQSSEKGSGVRRMDDEYVLLPESSDVVQVLSNLKDFSIFLLILREAGKTSILDNAVNPTYTGPKLPSPPSPNFQIEFPWWFGFEMDRSLIPPSPPPPPPPPSPPNGEVPELGPYTLFAPTDAAFDELMLLLGGGRVKVPLQAFIKLPELVDIIQYHIAYGAYTTDYMFNNTGIRSTLGPEIVVMKDSRWTEGLIALSDACVDKPTTGYPCDQQFEFDKCYEPFMVSPLAAGWQGGFCQKTCQRCTCNEKEGGTCAKVLYPDIYASNGVIHGISRVMFPPPMFGEVEESVNAPVPEEEIEIIGAGAAAGSLPALPGLPGLSSTSLPTLPRTLT